MCTEYPVQSIRCWMERYPGDRVALPEEIDELRRLILDKHCHVRVISSVGSVLKVDVKMVDNRLDLDAFVDQCRPPVVASQSLDPNGAVDELLLKKVDIFSLDCLGSSDQESDFSGIQLFVLFLDFNRSFLHFTFFFILF